VKHLLRGLAPITERAWERLDQEARQALEATLAARRVVDFRGPEGWDLPSVDLGRVEALDDAPVDGARARLRRVLPLVEIRVPFDLPRTELEALARGAHEADLDVLREAALRAALAEDTSVLGGFPAAGIRGILPEAGSRATELPEDFARFPDALAAAFEQLRSAGVQGPYALLLGPDAYEALLRSTHRGGYPVVEHVRRELDGPVLLANALTGGDRAGVLVSTRGGDFELTVGQDFAIGYTSHTAETVTLYIEETFTFLPIGPEAAVPFTSSRVSARAKRG